MAAGGDLDGFTGMIAALERQESTFRERQLELQEQEVKERRKRRKLEEKQVIFSEVEMRMRVDPSLSFEGALHEAQLRTMGDDSE